MSKESKDNLWTLDEIVVNILAFVMMLSPFAQAIFELVHWLKFGSWLNWSVGDQFPNLLLGFNEVQWIGLRSMLILSLSLWLSLPFAFVGTLLSFRLSGFK